MNITYSVNQEPIVISKATLDILLKQENPGDLIALYTFYYYTAKWQKTDQPKATTQFTSEALGWSERRVRETKNTLRKIGLIEDIQKRGEGNLITGHYVKVNFIWTNNSLNQRSTPTILHGLEKVRTNASNIINNNIIQEDISVAPKNGATQIDKLSKFLPLTQRLANLVTSKKRIKVHSQKLKSWANSIRLLVEYDKVELSRVEDAMDWYEKHHSDDYVPVIESGSSMREKFIKLEAAIERQRSNGNGRTHRTAYRREPIRYKDARQV